MAKLTKAQILEMAKIRRLRDSKKVFDELAVIQVGDFSFDIPLIVGEDIEKFVNVTFTAKDVITDDEGNKVEYDPQIVIDRWNFKKKSDQAERKAERERKHAEAVKRASDRKAKIKAKAEAKKSGEGETEKVRIIKKRVAIVHPFFRAVYTLVG